MNPADEVLVGLRRQSDGAWVAFDGGFTQERRRARRTLTSDPQGWSRSASYQLGCDVEAVRLDTVGEYRAIRVRVNWSSEADVLIPVGMTEADARKLIEADPGWQPELDGVTMHPTEHELAGTQGYDAEGAWSLHLTTTEDT